MPCAIFNGMPKHTIRIGLTLLTSTVFGATGKLTLITRYGIPPVVTSKRLGPAIIARAREIGVDVSEIYSLAGIGYDQLPIASRGLETVTLSAGGFGGAALNIHSKRDRIDLINTGSLQ